jgi:2-C-methyl-D-erythritol 2,4-cyclodiphosphate synthase
VRIPHDRALAGHSDGDAVAHAITDALLGAAGADDIGTLFPDSDPANRGRDSLDMLRQAVALLHSLGWAARNVDVVVITEQPRIGPYRAAMRAALAPILHIDPGDIGIKGKSNEGMGWIGRAEGIACIATATIARAPSD